MRRLPPDAEARLEPVLAVIERDLAETELGSSLYIRALGGNQWVDDPAAKIRLRVALTAAAAVVEIIGALEWPTADRRMAVAAWHDQIVLLCAIDQQRFVAERRKQPWWHSFQESLRYTERTDSPSTGQQLKTFIAMVPISIRDFSAATARSGRTGIHSRTIERHLDDAPMGPGSVRCYQETLRELLGRKITFALPPSTLRRPRTGKKPAKHR